MYGLLIRLAAFFNPKAKRFVHGRKGLFARIEEGLEQETRPVIWMHCASVGEFEQGRPLLEKIREQYPQYALFLSFFSPSGYELRKDYQGADYVFYLPMDSPKNAKRFVHLLNPVLALFVKYEFWYHYLKTLHERAVPTILFSAHFVSNQPFFKSYGGFFRKMLRFYQHIFVQDEQAKQRLAEIGIEQVSIAGDTRFDRVKAISQEPRIYPNVEQFKGDKKLWVVGSSWPGDEQLIQKVFQKGLSSQYKLLLVPHEVSANRIQSLLSLFEEESCLWQAEAELLNQKTVAVVDEVGHLSFLYRYADVAWIGGGFGKGIHNTVEAAVFGIPVLFGPNYHRFREAEDLLTQGAAKSLTNEEDLYRLMTQPEPLKIMGQKAEEYVETQLGAVQQIMGYLSEKCL